MTTDPTPGPEPTPTSEPTPERDDAPEVVAPTSPDADPTPAPDPDDAPVPTEDELARTATPATVRHAPRFGAFLATGAVVGAVVGLLLAALIHPGGAALDGTVGFISFLDGQGAARFFTALAGAAAGALLGGLAAVAADRRSLRRR